MGAVERLSELTEGDHVWVKLNKNGEDYEGEAIVGTTDGVRVMIHFGAYDPYAITQDDIDRGFVEIYIRQPQP